ncbi:MAG: hypothetical protein AB7S81_06770 [Bdellovibrionales bacterium]
MEEDDGTAWAMVDGAALAEAVSTVHKSIYLTREMLPTLASLVQEIIDEAQSHNTPRADTFVSSFMNSLTASNPSLMKAVTPSRPAIKEGAIASYACSLASGQGK